MHPAHCGGLGDVDELRFAIVLGKHKSEAEEVSSAKEHSVETILDIVLAGLDGAEFEVRVSYVVEESGQCVAKLHGLRWRVRYGGVVEQFPAPVPRVIAQ